MGLGFIAVTVLFVERARGKGTVFEGARSALLHVYKGNVEEVKHRTRGRVGQQESSWSGSGK